MASSVSSGSKQWRRGEAHEAELEGARGVRVVRGGVLPALQEVEEQQAHDGALGSGERRSV